MPRPIGSPDVVASLHGRHLNIPVVVAVLDPEVAPVKGRHYTPIIGSSGSCHGACSERFSAFSRISAVRDRRHWEKALKRSLHAPGYLR